MKLEFEDELDSLPTMKSNAAATSTDFAEETPKAAVADKALTYNLDDDDNVGEEYSRTSSGADYLKVADNTVARIAFVNGPVSADFVHYHQNTGYVRCNSIRDRGNITKKALCCSALGDAKPRRALYILAYTSTDSKSGKITNADPSVTVKILRSSASMWKDIKRQAAEDESIFDHDYLLAKDPSEKALQVGIASHKNPPAWKVNEAAVLEALKPSHANQTALHKALGKSLTDDAISTILKGGSAPKGTLADLNSL